MTQLELARVAGLAENRYWRIENLYAEPTAAEMQAIADALVCPVAAAFMPGPGSPKTPSTTAAAGSGSSEVAS